MLKNKCGEELKCGVDTPLFYIVICQNMSCPNYKKNFAKEVAETKEKKKKQKKKKREEKKSAKEKKNFGQV